MKKLTLVSITVGGKSYSKFLFLDDSDPRVNIESVFPELAMAPRGTTYSIG